MPSRNAPNLSHFNLNYTIIVLLFQSEIAMDLLLLCLRLHFVLILTFLNDQGEKWGGEKKFRIGNNYLEM